MTYCLIVDDSRVIRTVARRICEELNFAVAEAEDGMGALRAAREKMPDIVLLDWAVHGMTGIEFVRGLRAQPEGTRPLILIAATEMDAAEVGQAVAAGANDYLMKPFDRESLSAKLTELSARPSVPRQSAAGR